MLCYVAQGDEGTVMSTNPKRAGPSGARGNEDDQEELRLGRSDEAIS